MKITRTEALFLYSVLFSVDNKSTLFGESLDQAEALMERIRDFLVGSDEQSDHDDAEDAEAVEEACPHCGNEACEDCDDDTEDDEVGGDTPDHDRHVTAKQLADLPSLKVKLSDGSESTLTLVENVDDEIDLGLDDDILFENFTLIKRVDKKTVEVWAEENWETYTTRRLPKQWCDLLVEGDVYLVSNEEGCD